jgi:hypothetical protein
MWLSCAEVLLGTRGLGRKVSGDSTMLYALNIRLSSNMPACHAESLFGSDALNLLFGF